ncbi:hypothetical protein [Cohnella cellulosilytica]|uniref:Uncharacterized protein n=1 Tax=Cohnella cellulosilytica TaxID=986710 RepID=A0ABW2F5D7_9BACL
MNSRKKRIVPRVALSALMLSAIAGPVAANAAPDSASHAAPVLTVASSVKAIPLAGASAIKLQDPLELAKQYAPDTVEAWESLLAKYDSLQATVKPVAISIKLEQAEAVADGLQPAEGASPLGIVEAVPFDGDWTSLAGSVKATGAGAIALEAVEGNVVFDVKDIGTAEAIPVPGVPVPKFTASTDAAGSVSAVPEITKLVDAGHAIADKAQSVTLAAPSPASGAVLQGRIELAKAAESKDAETIRASLAKLFEAYETYVEELQSSK